MAKRKFAGFPSPAQNYEELSINLNEILVPRPSCTWLVETSFPGFPERKRFFILDKSLVPKNSRSTETDSFSDKTLWEIHVFKLNKKKHQIT